MPFNLDICQFFHQVQKDFEFVLEIEIEFKIEI